MNLYIVKQSANDGYDTYDSFVCAAKDEDEARQVHPSGINKWDGERWDGFGNHTWTDPKNVTVMHIGLANSDLRGVLLSSFNAG